MEQPQKHPSPIIDSLRWENGDKGGIGPSSTPLYKGTPVHAFFSRELALEDLRSFPILGDTFPLFLLFSLGRTVGTLELLTFIH